MPTTFGSYESDQLQLLPPDIREWLPAGHHVVHYVNDLDLTAFYPPYEPPATGRMIEKLTTEAGWAAHAEQKWSFGVGDSIRRGSRDMTWPGWTPPRGYNNV